ncbi:MAG: FecR family protein [Gammaproteobacteria bacterium]|nr:FecR family protein [Gammaproteobacteria bacterium]
MHEQAAAWIARLRSDTVAEEDYQQFALWLAANREHGHAMDSMLELWDDLAVTQHLPLAEPAQDHGRRRWLGAALAAAACALFALILAPQFSVDGEPLQYQTGIGEQLLVDLADGSQITLNTNSRLEVALSDTMRHVALTRGEAFFQVERDTQRPFVVDAGAAEVRVMGTAFNIHLHGNQSDITVTSGVVRVTERGNPGNRAPATELLYANQSVSASSNGLARPVRADAVSEVAWREGKLVADSMPLAALVKEIGRYHEIKILIADPELAQRTVSGVFQLDSPDTILHALEHSFEIHSMLLEDSSILLISAPR